MLTIRTFTVTVFLRGEFNLDWEINDTLEDTSDYRFTILRSGAPDGPYSAVSPPLEDTYSYTDLDIDLDAFSRPVYYKIRVSKGADYVDYPDGQGESYGPPPDRVALELSRREAVRLFVQGGSVVVFPRRRFGPKCTYCSSSGVRRRSKCAECFDTGFVGGFFTPFEAAAEESASSQEVVLTSKGPADVDAIRLNMTPLTRVYAGDMVVTMSGERWEVSRVSFESFRQHVIKMSVDLDIIPLGDIRYGLSVDLETVRSNSQRRLKVRADLPNW